MAASCRVWAQCVSSLLADRKASAHSWPRAEGVMRRIILLSDARESPRTAIENTRLNHTSERLLFPRAENQKPQFHYWTSHSSRKADSDLVQRPSVTPVPPVVQAFSGI